MTRSQRHLVARQGYASNGSRNAGGENPFGSFVASGMPLWSAAVNAMKAGMRNAKIVCWGDSTTKGTGALGSGSPTNARSHSYPFKLAGLLGAAGIASKASSVHGMNGETTSTLYAAYNPEASFDTPADWTQVAQTWGGLAFRTNINSSKMHWTPTGQVDTFEIYVAKLATGGTMNVSFDSSGTPTETFGTGGTPSDLIKKTYSVALGTHTIDFHKSGGSECIVMHCIAYNSAVKNVLILNGGQGGATAAQMSQSTVGYSHIQTVTAFAPDLCIINCGLNDFAGTSQASFEASLNLMVDTAQLSGDALLVFPNSRGNGNEPSFVTYFQNVAAAQNVPFINIQNVLGSLAVANAAGDMSGDSLHPSEQGYTKIAQFIYNRITS